ncbi:hypothetical protein CVIRNUC_002146 [Coccomyxa viridis]|uniref:UBX domain-containing protein n=1 Tax=Coccomyxa viridis TaxID=1274662 RepID=A0AAV1HW49_9CHLO|nr:hypothetical protein CVIRNUC_002146 [Coccomyxa viridis]
MDDIGAKLKRLWKPKPKNFKGKGNVLGRGEPVPERSARAPPRSSPYDQQRQPSYAGGSLAAIDQHIDHPTATSRPSDLKKPASSPPAQQHQAATTGLHEGAASHHRDMQPSLDAEQLEQIEEAAATFLSSTKAAPSSVGTIAKVLSNIVGQPADPKYRKLRLANKRIQETVVDVDGGVELLQACGFELVFQEAEADAESSSGQAVLEGFAVLPTHADPAPLEAALRLLGHPMPPPTAKQTLHAAPPAQASPSGQAPSPAGPRGQAESMQSDSASCALPRQPELRHASQAAEHPRNTQVFFPAETSEQPMPRWFFDRSPSEVKAAFLTRRKKTELDETLMTRAYRDKLSSSKPDINSYASATIRIRLPEGLLLQGEFSAGEPTAAIIEWLTQCLKDPGCMYELIGPDRKPLRAAATSLRAAQLVPSVLFAFRRLGATPQQEPTLRADILRLAQ